MHAICMFGLVFGIKLLGVSGRQAGMRLPFMNVLFDCYWNEMKMNYELTQTYGLWQKQLQTKINIEFTVNTTIQIAPVDGKSLK